MKVGLFFGSFNPIHVGHLILSNLIQQYANLDQVWFVVSPQNPLKEKKDLLNVYQRIHLVELAIENNPKLKVCTIELDLPTPSYTIDTLTVLQEKHPTHQFSIIMGSDNISSLNKWKNYEKLLEKYPVLIYNRPAYPADISAYSMGNFSIFNLPLLDISASYIRTALKEGKSIQYLVPPAVWEEIEKSRWYR